jgi:UDP-GlcNAc3NAcA epimerase
MKILTVIGARPQFIKAAAVSCRLRAQPSTREILVHTGQHYDENMSDVFFSELGIPTPDHHLGVGSGSHGAMTGRMLEKIEAVILAEKPDALLVYGDTNSTLAGALAAAKLHVPVAHVEAGLRSFNRKMPEEINRVLTDHVSKWLFCPTKAAVENLNREGISDGRLSLVGDVMYDVALMARERAGNVARWGVRPGQYVLATIHRAENTDDPARLEAIFDGLRDVAKHLPVILPLHPRTRSVLRRDGRGETGGVKVIDPIGYLDMTALERHARLVVTDSGGVQKEAFFHRVPCVTLRDETEWVELVDLGWNRVLPPTSTAAVRDGILAALESRPGNDPPSDLYGGGQAAARIVRELT